MKTTTRPTQLSWTERNARVALGAMLIGATMVAPSAALGWMAVLPLLAVYPILTGLTGHDPLRAILHQARAYRIVMAGAVIALVGAPFVLDSLTAATMLLPLLGIYATLALLLGRAPLAALADATRTTPWIVPPAAISDQPATYKQPSRRAA